MASPCAECGVGTGSRVTRRGDGVVSWACPQHLAAVCDGMQRDDEVTELVVVLVEVLGQVDVGKRATDSDASVGGPGAEKGRWG